MPYHCEIPEPLVAVYRRVVLKAPERLREHSQYQLITLLHLKVGGERLATQSIELFKLMMEEERIFNRWLIREDGGDASANRDADEISDAEDASDANDEDDSGETGLGEEDDYADDAEEDDLTDDADL